MRSADQVLRARAKDRLAAWMTQPRSIEDIRQFLERQLGRPVVRRTAERYRDWMVDGFGAVPAKTAARRKGWKVPGPSGLAPTVPSQQLARCRRAAEWLQREGRASWAQALHEIVEGLEVAPTGSTRRELEVTIVSPGVRVRPLPWVEAIIDRAIQANRAIQVRYRMSKQSQSSKRSGKILEAILHPYGIVYSERPFLIAGYDVGNHLARDARGHRKLGWYALDRFERIAATEQPIVGKSDLELRTYVQRWFGQPRGDEEPFDVVWRFTPAVADRAALYEFHPTQRVQREPDGALVVRFKAAGSLEMQRHLITWGDQVMVLEPPPEVFQQMVSAQFDQWRTYFS